MLSVGDCFGEQFFVTPRRWFRSSWGARSPRHRGATRS